MTSNQIEYFMTVAKYLNFRQAGEFLYASQPTISRQISLLEEELGFELFDRNSSHVVLTPAGNVMRQAFREVNQYLEEQKKLAIQSSLGNHGAISIGLLKDMNLENTIMPHLKHFKEKYPNVEINYKCYPTGEFLKPLERKEIDIAFVHYFNVLQNKNYFSREIYRTKMQLLYSSSHPLAQKENLSIRDFAEETYITTSSAHTDSLRNMLDKIAGHYGMESFHTISLEYFDTVLLYVRSGRGFAFVDPMVFHYLENDGFGILELDEEIASVNFYATWNKKNMNPALPLLMNFISEAEMEP